MISGIWAMRVWLSGDLRHQFFFPSSLVLSCSIWWTLGPTWMGTVTGKFPCGNEYYPVDGGWGSQNCLPKQNNGKGSHIGLPAGVKIPKGPTRAHTAHWASAAEEILTAPVPAHEACFPLVTVTSNAWVPLWTLVWTEWKIFLLILCS